MLQLVLGQDQPVDLNCVHHLPPNIYTAVNQQQVQEQDQQQQQQDHKGVSVEYRARVFADPVKRTKIPLATKEVATPDKNQQQQPQSAAAKKKAAAVAASSSAGAAATSATSSIKSEFFVQWNLTRCLPFLRRPVSVLVELHEVTEAELPSALAAAAAERKKKKKEAKAESDSKKAILKFLASTGGDDDAAQEDEEDDEDEEEDDEEIDQDNNNNTNTNQKKKKPIVLIIPGMMTNTSTKDTIWIGRFDLNERLKSLDGQTPSTARRFFTISLFRMIIGSHLLIAADKKTYTIVVPLPSTFLLPSGSASRKHNKMFETEFASIETLALSPPASTTAATTTTTTTTKLCLNVKNAILIRGATEKRTQVEVVGGLNVYKRKDHMMREKRKLKPQQAGNFCSFSCSLDDVKTAKVAEIMNANLSSPSASSSSSSSASTTSGIDLVVEMTLGREDEVYPNARAGGGGGVGADAATIKAFRDSAAASRNKIIMWLVVAAVGFLLIGIITDALMKAMPDAEQNNNNDNNNEDDGNEDNGEKDIGKKISKQEEDTD